MTDDACPIIFFRYSSTNPSLDTDLVTEATAAISHLSSVGSQSPHLLRSHSLARQGNANTLTCAGYVPSKVPLHGVTFLREAVN